MGQADFGMVRIRLFPSQFSTELNFCYAGKEFFEDREIGGRSVVSPFRFDHQSGLIVFPNEKIDFPAILSHQIIQLNIFSETVLPILSFLQQCAGHKVFKFDPVVPDHLTGIVKVIFG